MSLRDQVVKQFSKPTGFFGVLVGYSLAFKNRERSEWVASLLDLKPHERVLEIGFGPGTDIARASRAAASVAGVDHSETMVQQASSRNREAIREGRVDLRLGSASQLPFSNAQFDCIFAINSAQFWKDMPKTLGELRRVLKPEGRVLLAVQPRNKGASEETARQIGFGLNKALKAAGFEDVYCEFREMRPVSTAAVLGRRPRE
ncbi:MAG TPA: methyltransferase domain-containing protein [Bryobacteraceae bacterium]|nr:methyltransferase domain-containing protein [Bryobacteraceae bacterium]